MSNLDLGPASVARVREAADIVDVVSDHVSLKRRGNRWLGLCPFHQEKTPSFSVDAERGLYYCFGCHAGGDVIRFVMELENLSFPEAVESLARRFGVTLPEAGPGARARRDSGERIRGILAEAQLWFQEQLAGPGGSAARTELERRGFPRQGWADLGFGFAPEAWRGLLEHLSRRHPEGAILEAGLAVAGDRGNPYDRFRNRITFPIHGSDGRIIAFGGRALGDTEPKYLNSPEGLLFHKRSTLFMLHRARRSMSDAGHALVVEGYFDCLSLHRAGFTQAVATLGTALTTDHGRILRRLAPLVLLCYDADAAGRRAAATGAGILLEAGLEVAIVSMDPGQDPDDVIREEGEEAFRKLLERPVPLIDFLCAELPEEPAARRRAGIELAPTVGNARDPVTRLELMEELARRLDLPVEAVREYARKRRPRRQEPSTSGESTAPVKSTIPSGERELLRILIECDPVLRQAILGRLRPELLESPAAKGLVEALAERAADAPAGGAVRALLEEAADPALSSLVAEICLTEKPEITEAGIRNQLRLLFQRQTRLAARRLQREIEAAEARGDIDQMQRLQAEKMALRQEKPEI